MRSEALLLLLVPALPLAGPAAAHCSGTPCLDAVERLLVDVNEASDNMVGIVALGGGRFHPPELWMEPGNEVLFVHADAPGVVHWPRASHGCASGALAFEDPESCVPRSAPEPCFDVVEDLGTPLAHPGDPYGVAFWDDRVGAGPEGLVEPRRCPADVFVWGHPVADGPAIPYYCVVHGGPAAGERGMRGEIVISVLADPR